MAAFDGVSLGISSGLASKIKHLKHGGIRFPDSEVRFFEAHAALGMRPGADFSRPLREVGILTSGILTLGF